MLIKFLLFITSVLANSPYQDALIFFSKGDYLKSLELLKKDKSKSSEKYYWLGHIHGKLQNYNLAKLNYFKAIKLGSNKNDLNYSLGQILYSLQDYNRSRKQFRISAKKNFKKATSLYYMGHISQLQSHYQKALNYYRLIEKLPNDNEDVLKAAKMQKADIYYLLAQNAPNKKKLIKEKVLPQYRKALDYKNDHPLTQTIQRKMFSISNKYKIDERKKMGNGRFIPNKKSLLIASLDTTYSTNVISESDTASVKASKRSSLFNSAHLSLLTKWYLNKTFMLSPKISTTYSYYHERDIPDIYENDNYTIEGKIDFTMENSIFNRMSQTKISLLGSQNQKDYLQTHSLKFYKREKSVRLEQKIFGFKQIGETTFGMGYTDKERQNTSYSSSIIEIYIDQYIKLNSSLQFLVNVKSSFERALDEENDTNVYSLRISSIILQKFFKYFIIDPSLYLSVTDTLNQKATRGTEININPEFKIKFVMGLLDFYVKYAFTKNLSDDEENYKYSKNDFAFGISTTL